MKDLLKRLQTNNQYVSVYHDETRNSSFEFGHILCVDDLNVALLSLSLDGKYDGIVVFPIDEIIRIETETQYAEKMARLQARQTSKIWIPRLDEVNLLSSMLKAAKAARKLVTVTLRGLDDVGILGLVDTIENNYFSIMQIDDYGRPDGKSYALLEDITAINCNSEAERRIEILYNTGNSSVC